MIYIGKSYSAAVYELPDITLYIIRLTTSMGPGPLNVALIAKPNRELRRVLLCLKSRNHDVLLIDPPRCCPPLFSVESLLEHARLLDGATPRFKALLPDYMYLDDIDEEFLDIKEDLSKTVDFTGKTHSQIVLDFLSVILFKNDYKWYLFNLSLSLSIYCMAQSASQPSEGIGQPSFGMPRITHSLFVSLLMRSTTLSHQLLWKGVLDDDKKGSWRDALLGGNKEWASRIYFLPGGVIISTLFSFISYLGFYTLTYI